jgi:hypothetical protein
MMGVGHGANNSILQKIILFRNLTTSIGLVVWILVVEEAKPHPGL